MIYNIVTNNILMKTLEEYRARLYDRSPSIVANETGLSAMTLWRIKSGRAKTITLDTANKLDDYFEERP